MSAALLSDRQQNIVRLADRLAEKFAATVGDNDRDSRFPLENYGDLDAAGYLRLAIPREFGGEGGGVFDLVLAQERLARADASTALVTGMALAVIGRVNEQKAWPEAVRAEVFGRLAREGGTINTCITEPELGSISRGGVPATVAVAAPGGWKITGHKIFVTGAPSARYLLTGVLLPASEASPQGEIALAIVDAASAGLRIENTWQDSLSLRSCGNYDVFYQDVFVPDNLMVERRPVGGAPKTGIRGPGTDGWALPIAAVYLGIGQGALEAACDYASTRVPPSLGRPIASQPHVRQWIGEIATKLSAARAVLHETARLWDEEPGQRGELAGPIATSKYLCTNTACEVTEIGMRVAGGFSLRHKLPLERYFRDARGGLFQPPQDDLTLDLVGRLALDAHSAPAGSLEATATKVA